MNSYSYSIESVRKTIRILEILAENNGSLHVSQIAQKLDCHPSGIDRFLLTLMSMGYVKKDAQTNKFLLTDKFLTLSNQIVNNHPFTVKYLELMHFLAYDYSMTTHIMTFHGLHAIALHKDTQIQSLALNNAFFDPKRYLYCSAPGKLLLSQLPEEELDDYLKNTLFVRYHKNTLTTQSQIRAALERIRKVGYSVHDEEYLPGSFALSFPLQAGNAKGSLTFMCHIIDKNRVYNKESIERIKRKIQELD
jgi:DNA-binding IclR family transcriptional regulator